MVMRVMVVVILATFLLVGAKRAFMNSVQLVFAIKLEI